MTQIPAFDLAQLHTPGRAALLCALMDACAQHGSFYVYNHGISPERCAALFQQADWFFQLPETLKNQIHIRNSAHHRGYSQMKNARDWREQLHFGQELAETPPLGDMPDYQPLIGPNLWPESPFFRETVLGFLEDAARLGAELLALIAEGLGQSPDYFEGISDETPYHLLKLICYYPQPDGGVRPGVAPHCDWSLLTLLLQDDTGGLEVLLPDGSWAEARPIPDALFVNVGELLEIISGGRLRASPHRVINPSHQRKRISAPVFINPAMDAEIKALPDAPAWTALPETEHVHRVAPQGVALAPFRFGDSEWQRKGLGRWCYNAGCLRGGV